MPHQTFAIITSITEIEEQFLVVDTSSKNIQFFRWTDRAINGHHRWRDFDKYFQDFFNIKKEDYDKFDKQEFPLNKVEQDSKSSKALVKISIPATLQNKLSAQKNDFKWVSLDELKKLNEVQNLLVKSEKWILDYISHDPLDIVDIPANLFEAIRNIQEAREKNKLVIFAGAGISVDSGAPLWKEVSDKIIQSLGLDKADYNEALIIGQWLHDERGEKEYNEKLRDILHYDKGLQPNPIHHQLIRLNPRHIVTTNYDDLLEQALNYYQKSTIGKPYSIIKRDKDLPYAITDEYIIKMHGDWELMNFVFKEKDYLNYSDNFPLIEGFVKGLFSSHLILFVGFSFSDSNLKQIINWVSNILGDDFQPAYLFQTEKCQPHQYTYFKNRGIHPITFDDSLTNYLQSIPNGTKASMKSIRGQKTYDFLRMLEELNWRDYERLKRANSQHVIDQMYESLLQFDALNCIPPHFFERLFPFSPTSLNPAKVPMRARHALGYHLQTNNEKIISLMETIKFEDNEILINKYAKKAKAILKVKDYEKKLKYIFDMLRSSQVYCIQREGDVENHNRIGYGTQFEEKLLFSKWHKYEYESLLKSIYSKELEHSGDSVKSLKKGLLDGVILTQLHYFSQAYKLYSSLAIEALKQQNYPVFFICQYNRKYVGLRVTRSIWQRYSDEKIARIQDELETIDMHPLLDTMQSRADVRAIFSQLLDGELIGRYRKAIRAAYLEVLKYYDFFKSPMSESSGDSAIHKLIENFTTLHWVFHSNGILFGWDEHQFVEMTQLAFEGMIASICTDERSNSKLQAVDFTVINLACRYLDVKETQKIISIYQPTVLPIKGKNEQEELLLLATNWFSSFGEHLDRYLNDKGLYRSEINLISNNLLLLFSYFDFDDEVGMNKLINSLLTALSSNSATKGWMNRIWSMKYFIMFLKKHIKYFNQNQIAKVCEIAFQVNEWTYSFGMTTSKLIAKHNIEFELTDEKLVNDFLKENINNTRKMTDLVFFFPYLSPELKKALTKALSRLPKSNHLLLWLHAKCNGMFPKVKELSDSQIQVLVRNFGAIDAMEVTKDGTVIGWRNNFTINGTYWLAKLHYQSTVGIGKKTTKKLLKSKELPSFLRWMLDPENFDYSHFDCYWVFLFYDEEVLSRVGNLKIKPLRKAFQKELRKDFSPKLAEIYYSYFCY